MRRLLTLFPILAAVLAAVLAAALPAAAQYTISGTSPATVPVGTGTFALTLNGIFPANVASGAWAFCVYSGLPASSTPLVPTSGSTTSATVTVPGSYLSVNPSSFSEGQFDPPVYLVAAGATCAFSSDSAASNSSYFAILLPQVTGVSIATLPAPNPSAPTSYPTRLEINGSNVLPTATAQFNYSPDATQTVPTTQISNTGTTAVLTTAVPQDPTAQADGVTDVYVSLCNSNGTYTYCSQYGYDLPLYTLGSTGANVSANPPTVYPNGSVTLTANIANTSGESDTEGGAYVPGAPGGTVTFTDNGTTVGTAPLVGAGSLALTSVDQKTISTTSTYSGFGTAPFVSAVADFNKDGLPDTIVLDAYTGLFHLFLGGSPTATLQQESVISQASSCAAVPSFAVGDLNGDGYPDLAYLCGNTYGGTSLYLLYNNGDGTFGSPVYLDNAGGTQVGIGDFNGDGKLDLVIGGSFSGSGLGFGFYPYTNAGKGNFSRDAFTHSVNGVGTNMTLKDVNGDGKTDIVMLSMDSSSNVVVTTWIATGFTTNVTDGSGSFTLHDTIQTCGTCSTTGAQLFVTPLTTANPRPDILLTLPNASTNVYVSLNTQTGAQAYAAATAPNLGAAFNSAAVGDFNGDGFADLAVYNSSPSTNVFYGDGQGNFTISSQSFGMDGFLLLGATDLNNDGFADIVGMTANGSSSNIYTYITTGTTAATVTYTPTAGGNHNVAATYAGLPILLGSSGSASYYLYTPPVPTIAVIAPPATTPSTYASQPYVPGAQYSLNFQVTGMALPPSGHTTPVSLASSKSAPLTHTTPSTPIPPTGVPVHPEGPYYIDPTGTLTIYEGSNLLATATLSDDPTVSGQSDASSVFGSATAGMHTFTINYSGDSIYGSTSTTFTYTVTATAPVVTWNPPSTLAANQPLSSIENATANVPGTFRYVGANAIPRTYPAIGPNSITASFTPTDATDYTTATLNRVITGVQAAVTSDVLSISPTTQPYDTVTPTNFTVTLTGANVTPTGTVNIINATTSAILGSATLSQASPGQATATFSTTGLPAGAQNYYASYAGNAVYTSSTSNTTSHTVTKTTPVITWVPSPSSISYGTGLTSSQLDATASVPGSFSYSPGLNYVPTATGPLNVQATFTPFDTTDYATNTKTVSITVTAAPAPGVSLSISPALITYGQSSLISASLFSRAGSPSVSTGQLAHRCFHHVAWPEHVIPTDIFIGARKSPRKREACDECAREALRLVRFKHRSAHAIHVQSVIGKILDHRVLRLGFLPAPDE
jgi:hypothetical protein